MSIANRTLLLVLTGFLMLALLPRDASARTRKVEVDLGKPRVVKSVKVRWQHGRPRPLRVQTSVNGRRFKTAARVRTGRRARRAARPPRPVRQARRSRTPAQARDRPGGSHGAGSRSVRLVGAVARRRPARAARALARRAALRGAVGLRRQPGHRGAAVALDLQGAEGGAPRRPRARARGDLFRHRRRGADCGGSVGACVYGSPQGTAAAPITVEAYPGERPVIAAMVSFPSAQWFRFSGFIVDGAQAPEGAEGVSLGNTSDAAPSHVEISYNEIRNFGRGGNHYSQGILHYSGSDDALIGNRIHHIGRQRFYDHGIYLKAGRHVVVANDVISDITGGYGVQIWGDFDDSWVINNTVYGAAASGFIVGGNNDRGRPDRTVTANNIFAGQSGTSDSQQGYAAREYQPGSGNSTRHNLGWANARSTAFYLALSGPTDNRTADPRFADAGRRDLHLRSGSAAVNTAERFGLLLDADRHARGSAPDKGAFELG